MPTTINDVAREAGVHISTVSRTFTAPHLVNEKTRARVLLAANELGYRPSYAARALTTGKTHNVALIVADITGPDVPRVIKAAGNQAWLRGYSTFIAESSRDPTTEEKLVRSLAQRADGILLHRPHLPSGLIQALAREVPLVAIERKIPDVPSVLIDVVQGARSAIEHLAQLGHRHIGILECQHRSWTTRQLRTAVTAAARAVGAQATFLGRHPPSIEEGLAATEKVTESQVTAVLACSTPVATGLIEGLQSRGLAVPRDLSIIGIDDIETAKCTTPKLTTITSPSAAAARTGIDLLLGRNRKVAAQVTLPTELIVHDSTRSIRPSS